MVALKQNHPAEPAGTRPRGRKPGIGEIVALKQNFPD
jgi:hypothetical protein